MFSFMSGNIDSCIDCHQNYTTLKAKTMNMTIALSQNNLQMHQQSVLEGVKYACDKCDYKTTTPGSLKMHLQSVHEGVKYACDKCDYKATQLVYLKIHQQSVHEGVKYSCNKCEYKATER